MWCYGLAMNCKHWRISLQAVQAGVRPALLFSHHYSTNLAAVVLGQLQQQF
jgi:hypothetical protein